VSHDNRQLRYTRVVAMVTMALYSAGHATIGLPLLLLGTIWRFATLRPPLWRRTSLDLPLIVFGMVMVLSAVASAHIRFALIQVVLTVIPAAVIFGSFAWLVYHDPGVRLILLRIWALGAVPAALVGLVTGMMEHGRAGIPKTMGPNPLGTTLMLGSLCALGLAYRSRGRERGLWLACCVVASMGLLATESRSSLAGWLAGALYLAWREFHDYPRRLLLGVASGMAALLLAAVIVPTIGVRTSHAFEDLRGDRWHIWQVSFRILQAHPILGTGRGTFSDVYEQWKPPGSESKWAAHNLWLTFAVETGLVGFLSVLWIILTVFRDPGWVALSASLSADPVRPVASAMWIGLLVNQCGDNTLLVISMLFGFWLLAALLVVPVPVVSADGEAPLPKQAQIVQTPVAARR
jgi:O-antigen ligase